MFRKIRRPSTQYYIAIPLTVFFYDEYNEITLTPSSFLLYKTAITNMYFKERIKKKSICIQKNNKYNMYALLIYVVDKPQTWILLDFSYIFYSFYYTAFQTYNTRFGYWRIQTQFLFFNSKLTFLIISFKFIFFISGTFPSVYYHLSRVGFYSFLESLFITLRVPKRFLAITYRRWNKLDTPECSLSCLQPNGPWNVGTSTRCTHNTRSRRDRSSPPRQKRIPTLFVGAFPRVPLYTFL